MPFKKEQDKNGPSESAFHKVAGSPPTAVTYGGGRTQLRDVLKCSANRHVVFL